jgi:hypothetical protein
MKMKCRKQVGEDWVPHVHRSEVADFAGKRGS